MIEVYLRTSTDFTKNGDMVLFPTQCDLDIELNGAWELTLRHPIDNEGRFGYIEEEGVIKAPSFNGDQLFRIYDVERSDEAITAHARPIFLDAADEVFLVDNRPDVKNGQQALDHMMAGTRFSGSSDITKINTAYYVRKNLIEAIASDEENSFLNRWGGEIVYDNYTIVINESAGLDRGVRVSYGKNLASIDQKISMEDVVTRIMPEAYNGYCLDTDNPAIGQSEDGPFVDSNSIDNYTKVYTRLVKFDNIKLAADLQGEAQDGDIVCETIDDLRERLVEACTRQFEAGIDQPTVSLDINMVMLQNTLEYAEYRVLEDVKLGDTVSCIHEKFGIETSARVIGLTWNCITKQNDNVKLGNYERNYFNDLTARFNRVDEVIREDGTVVAERIKGVIDGFDAQLHLQSRIAERVGRAFLLEDLDENSELYGAMEAGTQGLRIAKEKDQNGDWLWQTAMTAAGMVANVIVSGLLADKTGRNYWNLDTGEIHIENMDNMLDNLNRFLDFSGVGLVIGRRGAETSMVLDDDSLEFKIKGNTVADFSQERMHTRNVYTDNEVDFYGKWATRKGADIDGNGNFNLNDLWIGGRIV